MRKAGDCSAAMLVIRLSAMGDILHTVPAAISLKKSFPERKLVWLVAPRWVPLLDGNPYIDELIPFDRASLAAWRRLRAIQPEVAFDFQGLFYTAVLGRTARPKALYGFDRSVAREPFAAWLYTQREPVTGPHRVDRNVQLAAAAGATKLTWDAWIPEGKPEGVLPEAPFVLASPFAGWAGKEWPLEQFDLLGKALGREGLELVLNVSKHQEPQLASMRHIRVHSSSLAGLIDATRRATAIIGLDSGPLHLAAALKKPGVALFGPTDPACTGPFGGTIAVLRAPGIETTYKRHGEIHASMRAITVDEVVETLLQSISVQCRSNTARPSSAARVSPL